LPRGLLKNVGRQNARWQGQEGKMVGIT
jgi:hypothetical protein